MTLLSVANFYQIGGTLQRDAPSYVTRRADEELYHNLGQGRFCYVLTSRQMGKSSLMVRTAERLRKHSCTVVILDLTAIGQNLTAEQWYEGLLNELGKQVRLEDELEKFWFKHEHVAPLRRWMRALIELVLPRCAGPLVIFIDEIDAVRSLSFSTDEFFAGIRELYNQRAQKPLLGRVAFCLLGVAAPSDLIRDARTTPFNIGQRIKLRDFTEAEAEPLVKGLGRPTELGMTLLKRILYWTGGHPYLTQLFCKEVAVKRWVCDSGGVDRICEELFLSRLARESDPNLTFVRDYLLSEEKQRVKLLELYGRIQRRERVRDDETEPLMSTLRLSGIVRGENGCLVLRNRIYAHAFDRAWIDDHMPNAELERQRKAYRRGQLRATAISAVIILLLGGATLVTLRARQQAEAAQGRAEAGERESRQLLYAARMTLAWQAWESGNVALVSDLLQRANERALTGFEWGHLWQLCHSDLQTLSLPDEIWTVAYSADGQRLAAGSRDGTISLWQARTANAPRTFKAHDGSVNALAFLPDSRTLVTGGDDHQLKLWDTLTGEPLAELGNHANEVHSVVVAPKRQWLISGSEEDGTVKIWGMSSRQLLGTFSTDEETMVSLALSPDEKTLALGSRLGSVELWELKSPTQARRLTVLDNQLDGTPVNALSFSPDGRWLAAVRADETIKFWTSQGQPAPFSFNKPGTALAFAPAGTRFALAQADKSVRLWDWNPRSGPQPSSEDFKDEFKGHVGLIRALTFAPDGLSLATGGQDHFLKRWALKQAKAHAPLPTLLNEVQALAFVPQAGEVEAGQLVVAGGNQVQVWATPQRRLLQQWEAHQYPVTALAVAPDGKTLATVGEDGAVKLWQVATGQLLRTLRASGKEMLAVAFSPEGRWLVASGQERLLYVWEAATGREVAVLRGHSEIVRALAFSPQGDTLVSGSNGGIIKFWQVPGWQEQAAWRLEGATREINAVAYAPNGQWLAVASKDGLIHLLDAATRKVVLLLKGHAAPVTQIIFSPDGKRLVSGSEDRTVKIWDAATGQELATFKQLGAAVKAVAFSPTGQMLAAGGNAPTVWLWQAVLPSRTTSWQSP